MKKDIENRSDIEKLVNRFYEQVIADPTIGYLFNEVARVNWEKHLPVMYAFWENTLFFTGGYSGNPMAMHQQLHRMAALKQEHFQQWNRLFLSSVDELFSGEKAELAKQRALSISTVMQLKILHPGQLTDLT